LRISTLYRFFPLPFTRHKEDAEILFVPFFLGLAQKVKDGAAEHSQHSSVHAPKANRPVVQNFRPPIVE